MSTTPEGKPICQDHPTFQTRSSFRNNPQNSNGIFIVKKEWGDGGRRKQLLSNKTRFLPTP